jgi:molybdopterin synthase catalytic subunit
LPPRIRNRAAWSAFWAGESRYSEQGDDVEALELQHYAPLTLPGMQALADDVMGRWALDGLMIWHRVGEMAPGDPIVLVAAASRHRRDALPPPISRWTISRVRVGSGSAKSGRAMGLG